jgi:hypothetical protein
VGARTLAKTEMRRGVGGEQTIGMEEFAEEVARTCEDDGEERDRQRCVGCAAAEARCVGDNLAK